MSLLAQILAEQPKFHRGETEVKRTFAIAESYLDSQVAQKLADGTPACYGIRPDVAKFIYHSVNQQSRTIETGAGVSTLVFALQMSTHFTITSNEIEVLAIKEYAAAKKVNIDKITFVIDESNKYLPKCGLDDIDLVLIDGKHAFPWPILDWFYTADRLKETGLMIIDDCQMYSVGILKDFMTEDPKWKLYESFGGKTFVFQKLHKSVHDVAWHMQPYIMNRLHKKSAVRRIWDKMGLYLSTRF